VTEQLLQAIPRLDIQPANVALCRAAANLLIKHGYRFDEDECSTLGTDVVVAAFERWPKANC
jgi:hypothetical protein